MSENLIDFGIAFFLLGGLFALMVWDRHEWKKEKRQTAQDEEKAE
jgi:hypothetical protein